MADPPLVLVVDDEQSYRDALTVALQREGFAVETAADGVEALERFDAVQPALVLLDVMLPRVSGVDVCRQIRTRSRVPIIMVTARNAEIDAVVGLEVGADDYVTKPFRLRELIARVRAALRRVPVGSEPSGAEHDVIEIGDVRLDVARHEVSVRGDLVALPLKEFELLELLLANAGRVLTRACAGWAMFILEGLVKSARSPGPAGRSGRLRQMSLPIGPRAALAAAAGAALLAAGCSPIREHQGYVVDPSLVAAIQPGVDNRDSVSGTLGRPTFVGQFDERDWYYVSRNTRQLAFNLPRPTDNNVLHVRFDAAGNVERVEQTGMDLVVNIDPINDKTPTLGRESNLFEELFGNIGAVGQAGQAGETSDNPN